MSFLNKLYGFFPHWIQNLFITMYNVKSYSVRYSGKYIFFLKRFNEKHSVSTDDLKIIQNQRFNEFISFVNENCKYYKQEYTSVKVPERIDQLSNLPIIDKEILRKNISDFYTIDQKSGILSKTGGTTGKSLEVLFTPDNIQERFAMIDAFRGQFGYKLGKRTAWFSGKSLLTDRDIRKHRFWKTDYWYKVRYYSTFHIKDDYLKYYIGDLIKFQPEFMVGFPSSILEIARFGLKNGYVFPKGVIKAIFPTAETITKEMRVDIESFFQTRMYDQYASSEGAPFIFECKEGNMHMELQSGVFEVLDENDLPSHTGRLVVTSFTTEGTPLIRYDIGDTVKLEDPNKICVCGNNNPMVKEILGRIDDYVFSPKNGKINLGNVSNTLKDTKGIVRFQAIQNRLDQIELLLVVDKNVFNDKIEDKFIQNWRDRIGNEMELIITKVDDIPAEKSGKYRIVKNNIKHML